MCQLFEFIIFKMSNCLSIIFFFFFNDTATTEIYTLSLHDALPIFGEELIYRNRVPKVAVGGSCCCGGGIDRKSTRLNSSHLVISYAVFCLKKKKKNINRLFPIYTKNTPH